MASAESDPKDPFERFLLSRRDKLFHRHSYPGNAGDLLIQKGSRLLLERLGIAETSEPDSAEVILLPGGNPSMWPGSGARLWQQLWQRFPHAEFVVGPAGFRRQYGEWRQAIIGAGKPVVGLFARDPVSFAALRSAGLPDHIEIGLSHDPALQLRGSTWLQGQRDAASNAYALLAFRDDHEGNIHGVALLEALRDLLPTRVFHGLSRSLAWLTRRRKIQQAQGVIPGELPVIVRDASREDLDAFLTSVRSAAEVHTDRLHVMLLAAMLDKPVVAYPTSHNKLETVYRHSLGDWARVRLSST